MESDAGRPFARVRMLSRMTGAAALHAATYDEVRGDRKATRQAVAVVAIAALAIGFGVGPGYGIPLDFVIYWFTLWGVWLGAVYLVGPPLLGVPDTDDALGQLARTSGFAQSPAILSFFIGFTGTAYATLSLFIFAAISLWWFAAMVVAVRVAYKLGSTVRSVVVAGTFLIPIIIIEMAYL